jgi:hypothetical protein
MYILVADVAPCPLIKNRLPDGHLWPVLQHIKIVNDASRDVSE